MIQCSLFFWFSTEIGQQSLAMMAKYCFSLHDPCMNLFALYVTDSQSIAIHHWSSLLCKSSCNIRVEYLRLWSGFISQSTDLRKCVQDPIFVQNNLDILRVYKGISSLKDFYFGLVSLLNNKGILKFCIRLEGSAKI